VEQGWREEDGGPSEGLVLSSLLFGRGYREDLQQVRKVRARATPE